MKPVDLTREQALEMRDSWQHAGPAASTLAARYGVSRSTVRRILDGTHPSVRGEPGVFDRRGGKRLSDVSRWGL